LSFELPPCILFDLDGTLVDSLPGIEFSARKAFANCGLSLATQNLRELIGPPIRTILSRAGNVVNAETLDALEREFRASYDDEGWRKSSCFPGTLQLLQLMRERGHRLFVVSNKPRHISLPILEREGILKYFDTVVTRDSGSPHNNGKDQMISALLADHSIASEHCVVVGDTSEDATAAATLGIRFIFMTHGYGRLPQTPSTPIWFAVDNFSQLSSWMIKETVLD
jgi:phosphoglycolate phosphatase